MIVSLQSSLGIVFQRDRLLLVNLKRLVRDLVLDCHEEIVLPAGLTDEESKTFYAQAIARFVKEHDLGQENAWVSIPRAEVLFRFLSLPVSAAENLREVVRYEVGKYIPYAEEEIFVDFLVLEREEVEKRLRLLLLVVERAVMEKYLAILRTAGLTPCGVEVSTTALLNFCLLGKNGVAGESPTVLLEISTHEFDLTWVQAGILRYSRAVNFDAGEGSDPGRLLASEFQTSFRGAFPLQMRQTCENGNPVCVFFTGTPPKEDLLAEMDEQAITATHPLPVAEVAERMGFSQPIPLECASAVGAALRGIIKVPWEVNLLPLPLRKKTSRLGTYLSLALILLALLLSFGWFGSAIVKERLELRTVEKQIDALKDEVNAVQKVQKEAQELAAKMESLNSIQGSYYSKLDVLRELSTIIPPEVWLTDLRCYRKEVNVSGFADSSSGLIAIIDGSPLFASSEFTAPITRDIEGKERFKLKTTVEK